MPQHSKRKSSIRIYEPLLVALAAAIGMIAGYKMNFSHHDYSLIKVDSYQPNVITRDGRIEEILRFVETNYVDSLDQDELSVEAIRHILRQLDPHSSYITAEELNEHNEKMEGVYTGVGVETLEFNDTFYITRLIPEGPALESGVQIGDAILSINGDSLTGQHSSFSRIRSYFKGTEAEVLDIQLKSVDGTLKNIEVESEPITVSSADQAFLLEDEIAYIKLSRFSGNTYEQFMQSLESMIENNQQLDLVIDLRDNPGGYLPEAVSILSQLFSEKGKLLCYTEGLNRKRSEYHSTGKTFYNIGKIVVLINEYSASGSEILAGAIQDWDRGIIIGQPSYGKGLVQEIFPLKNGGALRLTVAKYFTPSGRLIQKSYSNINSNFEADTNLFRTMLLERSVIGGGGIKPDILVEDVYNEHCYAYLDYIDYYLLYKMKSTGSIELTLDDVSREELNTFVQNHFDQDLSRLEPVCDQNIEDMIYSRYIRQTEGLEAYQYYLVDDDPSVNEALKFIKDNKTTLALLTKEK